MVVFYQQPNYERFQVASDERTISRKTDSLYRRKLREQSMLHVKRARLELRIPEGISLRGRCVRSFKNSFRRMGTKQLSTQLFSSGDGQHSCDLLPTAPVARRNRREDQRDKRPGGEVDKRAAPFRCGSCGRRVIRRVHGSKRSG